MLYLITYLRVLLKLQAKINAAALTRSAAAPPRIATNECLKNILYLQAVVRKGLCIHLLVTDVVPKKVPEGSDTIVLNSRTYYLLASTNISYNA
jgi:hypothetical protein